VIRRLQQRSGIPVRERTEAGEAVQRLERKRAARGLGIIDEERVAHRAPFLWWPPIARGSEKSGQVKAMFNSITPAYASPAKKMMLHQRGTGYDPMMNASGRNRR